MLKIIAECGCNFKNLKEAKEMIKRSKEIGCWASKFQLFSENEIQGNPYHDFLKTIIFDYEKANELFQYGKSIEQEVFFTPMYYPEAIEICEKIGVNYYKIRCKDSNNEELIDLVDLTDKPFFISYDHEPEKVYLNGIDLLCVPKYPAKFIDYPSNLFRIFNGISDHTSCSCLLEYVLNYKHFTPFWQGYFEKHVKLNNDCLENKWSISFDDLEKVIKNA